MSELQRYNWIYKELVKSKNDVSGALAYVLYKNDKIAYIESFAKDHDRQPSQEDLVEFTRMTNLPGALDAYRDRAELLLEDFLDNALTEQLNQFRQQIRDDAVVKAVKKSTLRSIAENLAAGLLSTLITFGFVLIVWMYNVGPSKILSEGFKKFVGAEEASAQQSVPSQR